MQQAPQPPAKVMDQIDGPENNLVLVNTFSLELGLPMPIPTQSQELRFLYLSFPPNSYQ